MSMTPLPSQTANAAIAWTDEMRVAETAFRLAQANVAWCPRTIPLTGLMLHDIAAYDIAMRPAIEQRYGLGLNLGVRGVVAGSAADRAGLREGDVIVAVGDRAIATIDSRMIRDKASFERTRRLETWLAQRLGEKPQTLTISRQGKPFAIRLDAGLGCEGSAQVEPGSRPDAWSDGRDIALSQGLLAQAGDADELAFVLAHEMGHNWLAQAAKAHAPKDNWLGIIMHMPVGQESRADLVGIAAMRRAHYDTQAAVTMVEKLTEAEIAKSSSRVRSLKQRSLVLKNAISTTATKP